jgi:hypothetical protein
MAKKRINLIIDEETYQRLLEVWLSISKKKGSTEVVWEDVIKELLSRYQGR